MSDLAIKISGVGKKYTIGQKKLGTFRESFSSVFQFVRKSVKEEFWALKDLNFEIKKGEAVGIIGRNGAGKSTLLKVLSQITQPTAGRIEINGRIASLLEVGTGFHPELTGRENIYLNGTILGMKRLEIRNKLDEIIAFSGVEKFIDTPVKHYSSGMYVRLAFAVAAHLEPEILIVDEVLAVGDAEFQKKCIGKMGKVASEGRTVLFVSHNMDVILKLCRRGIYLADGQVKKVDDIRKCVQYYQQEESPYCLSYWDNPQQLNHLLDVRRIELKSKGVPLKETMVDKELSVFIYFELVGSVHNKSIIISLYDEFENLIFVTDIFEYGNIRIDEIREGSNIIQGKIPLNILKAGNYYISVSSIHHFVGWYLEPRQAMVTFSFSGMDCDHPFFTQNNHPYNLKGGEKPGLVNIDMNFRLEKNKSAFT